MSTKRLPARIANSALARSRDLSDELDWLRPTDFEEHDLPRPIVLVNGAFDLLHVGHLRLIFTARKHAGQNGTVVCALDSDKRVAKAKEGRPILSWIERAAMLGYTPINSLVEIDSNEDMATLMRLLKPDLRVQGYSYLTAQSKFPKVPKLFVRDEGIHTTEIVNRIIKRYGQTQETTSTTRGS